MKINFKVIFLITILCGLLFNIDKSNASELVHKELIMDFNNSNLTEFYSSIDLMDDIENFIISNNINNYRYGISFEKINDEYRIYVFINSITTSETFNYHIFPFFSSNKYSVNFTGINKPSAYSSGFYMKGAYITINSSDNEISSFKQTILSYLTNLPHYGGSFNSTQIIVNNLTNNHDAINLFNLSKYSILYSTNFDLVYGQDNNLSGQGTNEYPISDLTINDITYHYGDSIPAYKQITTFSEKYTLSGNIKNNVDEKINYLDIYLDSTITGSNSGVYDFSISYLDNYNYNQDLIHISYADLNSFSFKGLVNDNGLYHWEDIINYVDTSGEDGFTDTTIENTNGLGFYVKGKFNYDFTNYEEIKFSIGITNGNNYNISYSDNLSSIDNYFEPIFGSNNLNNRYDRVKSKNNKYIIFSTYESFITSYGYYKIGNDLYTQDINYNTPGGYKYINIFNYNTLFNNHTDFIYNDFMLEKNNFSYYDFSFSLGTLDSSAFGIYLDNSDFDYSLYEYYVFIPNGIYFSYTNLLDNSTFIDNTGNIITNTIVSDSIPYDDLDSYDYLDSVRNFMKKLKSTSLYFNKCFDVFFQSLPELLRGFIVSIYTLALMFLILRMGGWGD